jgi:hypothetical protein
MFMDPKQEIIGTAVEIQVLAEEARDELPRLYTPLVEIERLAIEIARNCTGGEFPQVRGSTGSESPRVIEHAEEQASLTGIGYHEADLKQAPEFKQNADLGDTVILAEKGTNVDAEEKGMVTGDALAASSSEYRERLRQAVASNMGGGDPASQAGLSLIQRITSQVDTLLSLYARACPRSSENEQFANRLKAEVERLRSELA